MLKKRRTDAGAMELARKGLWILKKVAEIFGSMLKKRTTDAEKENDRIDSEKGSKMKLETCFRGLDCLLLRHSAKNIGGLLFLGFYCSIQ